MSNFTTPRTTSLPEKGVHLYAAVADSQGNLWYTETHGNRLGMGGGYYDTSLAYLRTRRLFRKPKLIGVAYDFQRVAMLPSEPWDVPLDAVLTDRGLYRF